MGEWGRLPLPAPRRFRTPPPLPLPLHPSDVGFGKEAGEVWAGETNNRPSPF